MATKKHLPAPRFSFWRNKKGEFNYHTIGANGKLISGSERQGYKRFAGLRDNIISNALVFGVKLKYYVFQNGSDVDPIGEFQDTVSDLVIPLYRVDAPK